MALLLSSSPSPFQCSTYLHCTTFLQALSGTRSQHDSARLHRTTRPRPQHVTRSPLQDISSRHHLSSTRPDPSKRHPPSDKSTSTHITTDVRAPPNIPHRPPSPSTGIPPLLQRSLRHKNKRCSSPPLRASCLFLAVSSSGPCVCDVSALFAPWALLASSSSSPVFRSWFPEHTLRTRLASSFGPEPVLLLHLLALACLRLLSSVTVHVAV